jgi:hypothetical protein
MVESVAADTRLMELIDAGAFHALGGGADVDEEWLDDLQQARARATP